MPFREMKKQAAIFVRGAMHVRSYSPGRLQFAAIKHPNGNIGIAYIKSQQHV